MLKSFQQIQIYSLYNKQLTIFDDHFLNMKILNCEICFPFYAQLINFKLEKFTMNLVRKCCNDWLMILVKNIKVNLICRRIM